MRRADRLFQIIQLLRNRRLTTAAWLAGKLEMSQRTIYRDIQDLIKSGVPIEGEAGMGYRLHKSYDLPPLMFDINELSCLVLGARMVAALGGKMQQHAENALSKLNSALPAPQQEAMNGIKLYAPSLTQLALGSLIDILNQAIRDQLAVKIDYQRLAATESEQRTVYPLGIFFWSDCWTLVGWCKLRDSFRHFRLDRILAYQLTTTRFVLQKHQTLATFFELVRTKKI